LLEDPGICLRPGVYYKFYGTSTLSQKSATVAENGETTATVAEFGDSGTFLRQIVALFCDSVDRLLSSQYSTILTTLDLCELMQ